MTSDKQRKLFEIIHDRYQNHYYDKYSNYYRELVINHKFKNELINSKKILEVGCGGASNFLTFFNAGFIKGSYHGIDVSQSAVTEFRLAVPRSPKYKSTNVDFASKFLSLGEKYDLILFIGVLHHMTHDLEQVISNVERCLSVGGKVIFLEPNAHFLNFFRRLWYQFSDDFDDTTERALTASEIDELTSGNQLILKQSWYIGNIGFFIILQSMVLRTPKWLKFLSYKSLTRFDLLMETIQTKYHLAALLRIYEKVERK